MKRPSVMQAFTWHFSISVLVFIVLVALMMKFWFPGDLFLMDGGWQGLKIIAPIDLVLGPALTLLFYRPLKKSLKFDMTMIASVQILALAFGVYTAYQQRTAALVFAENRFETISYSELKAANKEMQERDLPFKTIDEFGGMPAIVYAIPYADKEDYKVYFGEIMNGAPELRERSARYIPISQARKAMTEWIITDKDDAEAAGETVEIPASATADSPANEDAAPAEEVYKLVARYIDGTIKFDGDNYKIERNGSLFADN